MKKALKNLWLKALRSGDYNQADGILKRVETKKSMKREGFCCLGVLADIVDPKGWAEDDWYCVEHTTLGRKGNEGGMITCTLLPHNCQIKLAEMNDEGRSFEEIADYIEKNVSGT